MCVHLHLGHDVTSRVFDRLLLYAKGNRAECASIFEFEEERARCTIIFI